MTKVISIAHVAMALASRLTKVVPSPLRVVARDIDVEVFMGDDVIGGSIGLWLLRERPGALDPARLEAAAYGVLSDVQDCIAEYLMEPWPRTPSANEMAVPDTDWHEEQLHLWFGDKANPVIALSPVLLHEIVTD